MPDVIVSIGGRDFEVACQPGEEHYLRSAAAVLDAEAKVVTQQVGRVPEARLLLMAGLMLADKAAGGEDQMRYKDEQIARLEEELAALKSQPAAEPRRIEVPVVPEEVTQTMAELAARAEALAAQIEEQASA